MGTQQAESGLLSLEEKVEAFRQECELLHALVEDTFNQLETMNQRLAEKSAELARQQAHMQQREQEWLERQSENEDIREFFVHQNDRIAHAVDKLVTFEEKFQAIEGDSAAHENVLRLIAEMREEQQGTQVASAQSQQLLQQKELVEERQLLRDQLREVRELLELRSQWEQQAPVSEAPSTRNQGKKTTSPGMKGASGVNDHSVLAQFAKLNKK